MMFNSGSSTYALFKIAVVGTSLLAKLTIVFKIYDWSLDATNSICNLSYLIFYFPFSNVFVLTKLRLAP